MRRDFAFVHYVMPRAFPSSAEEQRKKIRSIRGGEWNPTVEMACFIAFPKIYCREIATSDISLLAGGR